jgi:putative colanic acid biosynthesis acetyltransferase WcaF
MQPAPDHAPVTAVTSPPGPVRPGSARNAPVPPDALQAVARRRELAARALWALAWGLLGRFSPRPAHRWRALLLRAFGARLGPACHIYGGARIHAPWRLHCGTGVAIADGAWVYNPAGAWIDDGAVISQQAFLCGATHDCDDPAFPLRTHPITVGARAWIAARATVLPGVHVGEGAVLGACSVATADLAAWTVHAGHPARALRPRARDAG